jgi:predicted nucleotidyltransferase
MDTLKINDDYAVGTDAYQFILMKRQEVSDEDSKNFGEEYYVNVSYHSSLDGVFKKLLKINALTHWPDLEKIFNLNKEISSRTKEIVARLNAL